jgi:hypothetical protein
MISGTVLAIFFVPLFFVVVMKLFEARKAVAEPPRPIATTPILEGQ